MTTINRPASSSRDVAANNKHNYNISLLDPVHVDKGISDDFSVVTLKQSNITPGYKHITTMSINSTDATTGAAQDDLSLFLALFVTNEAQRIATAILESAIRDDLTLTGTFLYMRYNAQFADSVSNHDHALMEEHDFQEAFENAMLLVTANRTINIPVQVGNRSDESMSVSVSPLTAPSDSMDTSSALP